MVYWKLACFIIMALPASSASRFQPPVHQTLQKEVSRASHTKTISEGSPNVTPPAPVNFFKPGTEKEKIRTWSLDHISNKSTDLVLNKRSTDNSILKMTEEDCKDDTTFGSLNGTYEVYKMVQPTGVDWDEGENVTFGCRVSYNTPWVCNHLLNATVKNMSLMVNGEVQTEGDTLTTSYDPDNGGDAYIYFHLILHYESHHQSSLTCSNQISETATLVSEVETVMKVDELYEVKITPLSTSIKVGNSFTLTCHTETHRALPHIRWSRRLEEGAEREIVCGENNRNAEFTCVNSTDPPLSKLIVRTIETEDFVGQKYSYFCRAMSILHSSQPHAETRVTVQAIDRLWITILGLAGGAVVGSSLLVAVIIIVVRWRSRRQVAKVSIEKQ